MSDDTFVAELRRRLTDAALDSEAVDAAVLAYQQTQLALNGSPLGTWLTNSETGERAWRTRNADGTPIWQVFSADGLSSHFDLQAVLQLPEQWT